MITYSRAAAAERNKELGAGVGGGGGVAKIKLDILFPPPPSPISNKRRPLSFFVRRRQHVRIPGVRIVEYWE